MSCPSKSLFALYARRLRVRFFIALLVAAVCANLRAQQPATSADKPADAIAKAREALRSAESAHPGNTPEVGEALVNLLLAIRDAGKADDETLTLAERDVQLEIALHGKRSKDYADAIETKADILLGLNRYADARILAEEAFEIAQKEFPQSSDAAGAANTLGRICSRLGDFDCALRANNMSVELERRMDGNESAGLSAALNNRASMKSRMGDTLGAIQDQEEALAIAYKLDPTNLNIGVLENNLGSYCLKAQQFEKAVGHFNRALDLLSKLYGADSPRLMMVHGHLGELYTRMGQFPQAWKDYEFALRNTGAQFDVQALNHASVAQSLALGGDPKRAIDEGLTGARMSREMFVLQARTLPERQALAYDASRPHGLDTPLSVALKHPEIPTAAIYQEVVRSRALVAEEMARRQRNLNASNDPQVAALLKELDQARADLLALERSAPGKSASGEAIPAATTHMESIERELAQHSVAIRNDERVETVSLEDIRRSLPPRSVLISYVAYRRGVVDGVDPALSKTPSYMAFVLHPQSDRIRVIDLGDSASIDALIQSARAAADEEAHSGGLGSMRNERAWREAGLALRHRIWDPFQSEIGNARLVLVVPDGNLNLVPFGGLPSGKGYLVEHGPVIHLLSSERDLVPTSDTTRKTGLLAIGSPQFDLASVSTAAPAASPLRDAHVSCDAFRSLQFSPLPGSAAEVTDIRSEWRRWNHDEVSSLVVGADATRDRFLEESAHNRVLHVATHAFLLDKSCGNGNPLLHSGLVFAGANQGRESAILTAQQIASLDLSGVDWAVLSGCNTGNGVLQDGEGVLGLQRAFRVAGAHSVVMTLWPIDDNVTRQFMRELYAQRLGQHATTADAVWNSSRQLLLARRAAGKSTHPWYWAGFVGSGAWN